MIELITFGDTGWGDELLLGMIMTIMVSTSSLAFGLVIGTIFHLRSIIDLNNFKNICFILIGTSIGIFLSLANPSQENDNLYFVLVEQIKCMLEDGCLLEVSK